MRDKKRLVPQSPMNGTTEGEKKENTDYILNENGM